MNILVFCLILAYASAAPLSPELSDDFKWKSVDLNKDGQPDVVPMQLTPEINQDLQWKSVDLNKDGQPDVVPMQLTSEINKDLQWKSVDLNKDGLPDVTPVVQEAKADILNADKAAPLGYSIAVQTYGTFVEYAPDVNPVVEAAPVVENTKEADIPFASVVDAPTAEVVPIVEPAPVADAVTVQAAAPAIETVPVAEPIAEAALVAEEIKVNDVQVADTPAMVEVAPVVEEIEVNDVQVADTPAVVEVAPVAEEIKVDDTKAADTPVVVEEAPEVELKVPEPVQDTDEIQEAKAAFFRLYEEAAAAAAAVDEDGNPVVLNNNIPSTDRKTRQVVSFFNPSIVPYTLPAFIPAAHPYIYRAGFPYKLPLVYPTVPTPVTVKNDRKKRQIAFLPSNQLYKDFIYKSVDLNQDGQPDKAVITTPQTVPYLPYTGYPYSAFYPYSYPFANGLHF